MLNFLIKSFNGNIATKEYYHSAYSKSRNKLPQFISKSNSEFVAEK